MSERDEMRKLIDVIERGAISASVEQNVEDMRLFANTASFIANKLDVKLKQKTKTSKARRLSLSAPKLPVPKPPISKNKPKPTTTTSEPVLPAARSTATSSTDFERLRGVSPPQSSNPNTTIGTIS